MDYPTLFYFGIISLNHEIRIPSLNNQDFIDLDRVTVFFVAKNRFFSRDGQTMLFWISSWAWLRAMYPAPVGTFEDDVSIFARDMDSFCGGCLLDFLAKLKFYPRDLTTVGDYFDS